MRDEAVPIQDCVHGADGRRRDLRPSLSQALPNLGRAPGRTVLFQPHNQRFDRPRELIRVPIRPAAPIGQPAHANLLIPLEDLVAGLARDAELLAERRHRLTVQEPAHEAHPFIHHVTLLPRHAPSC